MSEVVTGGCQCRRIRYRVAIADDDADLCHCGYCRRATGGVSAAFKQVAMAELTWQGDDVDWFQSSPIARRAFCRTCGTPLGFQFLDSDRMDLTVGSFDDPSRFRPILNFCIESALTTWLDVSRLPAKRLDEHAPVVDRWMKAVGKLPD